MNKNHISIHVVLLCSIIAAGAYKYKKLHPPVVIQAPIQQTYVAPEPVENPLDFTISKKTQDHYLTYPEIIEQLKQWKLEAGNISSFGFYGKTSKDSNCTFLRVGTVGQPKVLLHACLHGDERLSTGCLMGFMGQFLADKSDEVKWLMENRDIYFVPVLSPDTYLKSREVEGQDPNRSYPCPKRPNAVPPSPVKQIINLCERENFRAVISNHTFGRVYLTPSLGPAEDRDKIVDLAKEMSTFSGYNVRPLNALAGKGNGYETDWYYQNGSVALLIEWSNGPTHNMPFSKVQPELDKNYKAILTFLKKAPEITLTTTKPSEQKSENQPLDNR